MSLFGKACLIKALHQSQILSQAKEYLIKELLNKIKVTTEEAHFEDDEGRDGGWIFSSNGRTIEGTGPQSYCPIHVKPVLQARNPSPRTNFPDRRFSNLTNNSDEKETRTLPFNSSFVKSNDRSFQKNGNVISIVFPCDGDVFKIDPVLPAEYQCLKL